MHVGLKVAIKLHATFFPLHDCSILFSNNNNKKTVLAIDTL